MGRAEHLDTAPPFCGLKQLTKLLKRFEAVGAASLFDQGLSADGRTGTSNRTKVVFSEHPRSITILLQDRLCMNAPNSALAR